MMREAARRLLHLTNPSGHHSIAWIYVAEVINLPLRCRVKRALFAAQFPLGPIHDFVIASEIKQSGGVEIRRWRRAIDIFAQARLDRSVAKSVVSLPCTASNDAIHCFQIDARLLLRLLTTGRAAGNESNVAVRQTAAQKYRNHLHLNLAIARTAYRVDAVKPL